MPKMDKLEMKTMEPAKRLPSQPPPYTPPEPSISPALNSVQPGVSTGGANAMLQDSSLPSQQVTCNIVIPKTMPPTATPYMCPSCKQMIVTNVVTSRTLKQHLTAALLCVLVLWPCVCIPYCMASCRKAEHFCPLCDTYIGTYA